MSGYQVGDPVEYVKHGQVVDSPYPDDRHAEPGWIWVRWSDGALTMIAETAVRRPREATP